ncbi:hypothetical protein BDR04DRAFT_154252 [Suillus decipiens]|nr:hypothetical protein BDR04DRAFT_154252 [Suillus decipiens]
MVKCRINDVSILIILHGPWLNRYSDAYFDISESLLQYTNFLLCNLLWLCIFSTCSVVLHYLTYKCKRHQIDRKNFWCCDGFIATPEIGDIRVNVSTFDSLR